MAVCPTWQDWWPMAAQVTSLRSLAAGLLLTRGSRPPIYNLQITRSTLTDIKMISSLLLNVDIVQWVVLCSVHWQCTVYKVV